MTSLQIGLILGGVVLVVGVLIFNWMQERRLRRRIAAASAKKTHRDAPAPGARDGARVEPTLAAAAGDGDAPPAAGARAGIGRGESSRPAAAG